MSDHLAMGAMPTGASVNVRLINDKKAHHRMDSDVSGSHRLDQRRKAGRLLEA